VLGIALTFVSRAAELSRHSIERQFSELGDGRLYFFSSVALLGI